VYSRLERDRKAKRLNQIIEKKGRTQTETSENSEKKNNRKFREKKTKRSPKRVLLGNQSILKS